MRTMSIDGFLGALAGAGLGETDEVLIAVGGFGVTDHDRVGLLVLDGARVLADAYLPTSELDALWHRLAHARPRARMRRGGWNTMHATGWSFAWTDDVGPLVVLDEQGRVAWTEGERLCFRAGEAVERLDVAAVEPWVASDWVMRGVRLRLRTGGTRDVASEEDLSPRADFTYDGLNLLADTSWTHELARAVARGLGPPVVDCTR